MMTGHDPSSVVCRGVQSAVQDHHTVAKVRGELLCVRPGDYTLVSEQDPTLGESELHLLLHLCCDGELSYHSIQSVYSVLSITRLVTRLWWYESVCG